MDSDCVEDNITMAFSLGQEKVFDLVVAYHLGDSQFFNLSLVTGQFAPHRQRCTSFHSRPGIDGHFAHLGVVGRANHETPKVDRDNSFRAAEPGRVPSSSLLVS